MRLIRRLGHRRFPHDAPIDDLHARNGQVATLAGDRARCFDADGTALAEVPGSVGVRLHDGALITAHGSGVVVHAPDGKRRLALSGSEDVTAFDVAEDGRIAFGAGSRVGLATPDGEVLWHEGDAHAPAAIVRHVVLAGDTVLSRAAGAAQVDLLVWDVDTGEPLHQIPRQRYADAGMAAHGSLVATATNRRGVLVWDLEGAPTEHFGPATAPIAFAFGPGGLLFAGDRLWTGPDWQPGAELGHCTRAVWDGDVLVRAVERRVERHRGSVIDVPAVGHSGAVRRIVLGDRILTAGDDGTERAWVDGKQVQRRPAGSLKPGAVEVAGLQVQIDGRAVRLLREDKQVAVLKGHTAPVTAVCAGGEAELLSADADGLVLGWKLDLAELLKLVKPAWSHDAGLPVTALAADEARIATGHDDVVAIWAR